MDFASCSPHLWSIALWHVCRHLGFHGLHTDATILGLHECLLGLWTFGSSPHLHGLGPQTVETQLAALLVTKGVPWTAVSERATAAVHKLNSTSVQRALQQANAWGVLKSFTSKLGKSFQFVTKDELQAHIAQKAADKHGAQISTRKKVAQEASDQATSSSPGSSHLGTLSRPFCGF